MADVEVSDAEKVRIRDFVVRYLYDYHLAEGEGIFGTVIQQSYIEQIDRVSAQDPVFIKKQKRIFKAVVNEMVDEDTEVYLINVEGKGCFRLHDSVKPRDIDVSPNEGNCFNGYIEHILEPNVQPEGSHRRIDRSLREGIDPKGLAPKSKKRRITEVDESDVSEIGTPSRMGSRNSSPQRFARPALAPLDGNRRISAPEQFYSPSVQSEPYPQNDFFPNPSSNDENLLSLPIWLQKGLSDLRQKYPNDRFKATDGHDIKCLDCDTTSSVSKYKRTNNFENHLKSKGHIGNMEFRLANASSNSRPASALSIATSMPPPPPPPLPSAPLPLPTMPVVGLPDNSGSNGGLLESMIANVVQQSTGPLTAHIRNLENCLLSSESSHKRKLDEMAKQLDESEHRSRDLYSRLEECRSSTEAMSARLLAAEAGSREQMEISRRLKLVEQTNESLRSSRISHTAQLKEAQGDIKLLKQAPISSIESAIADQANRLSILGQQHEISAQEFSKRWKYQEELRRKMMAQMEDERQKLNERVNLLQTALASRHGVLEELKNKVSQRPQHDQAKLDALRSQITLESHTECKQLSTRIKAIEKRITQGSNQFTSLDHRTAEWVDTTDKKHDAKLAELESSVIEEVSKIKTNLTNDIDDLKKQRTGRDGVAGAVVDEKLESVERMATNMNNRLAATEETVSQFVSSTNTLKIYVESLASSWKTWQEDREEELRTLDTEVMKNTSAMDKLQSEHIAFLDTTPKTIQQMERRLEEQVETSTTDLCERLQSVEALLTEKICSLQETQVKHRQSTLENQHKESDTLMNRIDEKLQVRGKTCADLAQKIQEMQKRAGILAEQKIIERLKGEEQRNKVRTESLIKDFVAKRDRELQSKYEETFRPLLLNYLTEKDQALRKEYDLDIEASIQARLLERDKELEVKYDQKFKPMIASFLVDQQKVLRDEYEARIEKLLKGFKDDILSSDKENKNPVVKPDEELKALVVSLIEERDAKLMKKHEADLDELITLHKAEMGILEEQTLERMLMLEQVIGEQKQSIEDLDCVFPLVLDDLNGLMMKKRAKNIRGRRDFVRARMEGE